MEIVGVVVTATFFVVAPGTLLAVGFTVRAIVRRRGVTGSGVASLVFFGGSSLITVAAILMIFAN